MRVYLVPTGETYAGRETYTRREEGGPPPLCDYETLYTSPSPAPNYLQEIYGYLASVCPPGIADEAFRNVPDSILPYSARSSLLPLHAEQGDANGKRMGLAQQNCSAGKTTDGVVAATLPSGWVPLTMNWDGGADDPEEVAYGPPAMMDQLKVWLDRYAAMLDGDFDEAPEAARTLTDEQIDEAVIGCGLLDCLEDHYDAQGNGDHYSSVILDIRRVWRMAEKSTAEAALASPAPQQPVSAEAMARFCPGCGSVGPVDAKYRDCCPDGSDARMVPLKFAEKCRGLFQLAIKQAAMSMQQPVAADERSADTARLDWLERFGCERFSKNIFKTDLPGYAWFDCITDGSEYSPTLRAAIDNAMGRHGRHGNGWEQAMTSQDNASGYELCRSIIHKCPAIGMPQSFIEGIGATRRIIALVGATEEDAQTILSALAAAAPVGTALPAGWGGFATWQDAATAERIRRVKAEQAIAEAAPINDKAHPRFIAGYDAGLKDGHADQQKPGFSAAPVAADRSAPSDPRVTHGMVDQLEEGVRTVKSIRERLKAVDAELDALEDAAKGTDAEEGKP